MILVKDINTDDFDNCISIGKVIEYSKYKGIDTDSYLDDKNNIVISKDKMYKLTDIAYLELYKILSNYRIKLRNEDRYT